MAIGRLLAAVAMLVASACVSSTGGGGGGGSGSGVDATTAADSAASPDAAADAAQPAADGKAGDSTATDGAVADAAGGDAQNADSAAADASKGDTQSGGSDAVLGDEGPGKPDLPPPPKDGGPAPDGGPVSDTLTQACALGCALQAICPGADPIDACKAKCIDSFTKAGAGKCADQLYAAYKCVDPKTITCDSQGKPNKPTGCQAEIQAVEDCIKGGTTPPGSCSAGPCYASAGGPGTAQSCGCSESCPYPPGEWKIDCDDTQCTCTIGGTKSPPIPQSNACSNPQNLLKSLCGAP